MEEITKILGQHFKPVSIFLYGSRSRTDFLEKSDFEVGVLFSKENYVRREEIRKVIRQKRYNIYPFLCEDFLEGRIDTPFQKKIYLRELILTGKTLFGQEVIEKMKVPSIKTIDLMQDLRFNLGYALAAVISHRNNDERTASLEFSKSCLFATRVLIMLKLRSFPLTYEKIRENSLKLDLGEYKELIAEAHETRKGGKYKEESLFQNISYLNNFIEPLLHQSFEKDGNKVVIK